jgi:beta-galactosidase
MTPNTFRGQALIIVQPQEEKGRIEVSVSSPKFNGSFTHSVEVK